MTDNGERKVPVSPGWEVEDEPYDWSGIYGEFSREHLLAVKADLAVSIENNTATQDEVDYIRSEFMDGNPDDSAVVEELMRLKSSHLNWIIARLNELD